MIADRKQLLEDIAVAARDAGEAILKIVREGIAKPTKHPAPMPAMGGAQLSDAEVEAVSRYVDSLTP